VFLGTEQYFNNTLFLTIPDSVYAKVVFFAAKIMVWGKNSMIVYCIELFKILNFYKASENAQTKH